MIEARPALYYPYIHIRSEHWLKATLLCVPVVKRIVPADYSPEDLPDIVRYAKISGPRGELLQTVPAWSAAADCAQRRLLEKLREHEAEILRKYDRGHAPAADEYWIHDAKFNVELLEYLTRHNLAWPSQHTRAYGHRSWRALHPILGSAIMTTLGLSVAREQQYDIVTPSNSFHETLLATKEDEIFDALLWAGDAAPPPTATQARFDLGQMVITLAGINYEALRPEDIPELQASQNFQNFQRLIRTKAPSIASDDDPEAYKAQLSCEAQEIIDAWRATQAGLTGALKDALFEQGLAITAGTLKTVIAGAGVQMTDLAIAGGIAVGLRMLRGVRAMKKQQHCPHQYLTEIVRSENKFLRMTFPLGIER
jgi:hypothetical protein